MTPPSTLNVRTCPSSPTILIIDWPRAIGKTERHSTVHVGTPMAIAAAAEGERWNGARAFDAAPKVHTKFGARAHPSGPPCSTMRFSSLAHKFGKMASPIWVRSRARIVLEVWSGILPPRLDTTWLGLLHRTSTEYTSCHHSITASLAQFASTSSLLLLRRPCRRLPCSASGRLHRSKRGPAVLRAPPAPRP